jgi:hypothetical protein
MIGPSSVLLVIELNASSHSISAADLCHDAASHVT